MEASYSRAHTWSQTILWYTSCLMLISTSNSESFLSASVLAARMSLQGETCWGKSSMFRRTGKRAEGRAEARRAAGEPFPTAHSLLYATCRNFMHPRPQLLLLGEARGFYSSTVVCIPRGTRARPYCSRLSDAAVPQVSSAPADFISEGSRGKRSLPPGLKTAAAGRRRPAGTSSCPGEQASDNWSLPQRPKTHRAASHITSDMTAALRQTGHRFLSKELEKSWRFLRFLPMHSDIKRSRQP